MAAVLAAALFVVSFGLAAVLVPAARRWAIRIGFLDVPAAHKIHAAPVPYGGGLALAATIVLTVLGAYAVVVVRPAWIPAELAVHFDGARAQFGRVGILLLLGLVVHLLGTIDDRRGLSPALKLGVELAVGAAFAIFVEPIAGFIGGGTLGWLARVAITAVWIAGVTNVFNFLDHMDGVCAGVALIVSAAFTAVAIQTDQLFLAAILTVLMGACAGFLLYNAHPARIFLGDGGSLLIGFMLGALTTVFTFYGGDGAKYPLYRYLAPLAVLAVPLCDAGTVVAIRLARGRPVTVGDRNHLAHRLVALGLTPRGAADTVYVLTLYTGVSAVMLYLVESTTAAALILAQVLVVFLLMRLLETAGRGQSGT
jgi:UDP-GlcNAc:undecaprenyl-phosphate GlcNAc-1-phosphate transferase